jgi:hypothetical protein
MPMTESVAPSPLPCTLALPPGYALVPVAPRLTLDPTLERQLLASELAVLTSQIGQLRRDRKSIGGPITQMAIGFGGMALSSVAALGTYGAAESNDASATQHDQDVFRRTAYVFTGLAVVGLVLGLTGTAKLIRHAAHNRRLNAQLKPLAAKRVYLAQRMAFGAASAPGLIRPR